MDNLVSFLSTKAAKQRYNIQSCSIKGDRQKVHDESFSKKLQCCMYSHLSNSRGGWNKHGGGAKVPESTNEEVGINVEHCVVVSL